MSLFTASRYWGGEGGGERSKSGLSLESLHKLAKRRAVERRRKERAETRSQSNDKEGPSERRRRKRKRLVSGVEEGEEEEGTSDGGGKKNLTEIKKDKEEEGAELGPIPGGEVGEDGSGALHPLTRQDAPAKKSLVHRQLPAWIQHPTTVESDILAHSVALEEIALPIGITKNLRGMGVVKLFPIQVAVIPRLISSLHGPLLTHANGMAPGDVCVCAPTGCGKTLCYVIPILSALVGRVVSQVRAIIVLPSQELAQQVLQVFEQVAHGLGVRIGLLCGQVSMETERSMLWNDCMYPRCSGVDVVVATPGRLVEHLRAESFASLRFLRFLVVDEADKLLDQQFQEWLPTLLEGVRKDRYGNHGASEQEGRCLEHGGLTASYHSLVESVHRQCVSTEVLRLLSPVRASNHTTDMASSPSLPLSPHPPLHKLLLSATMTQNPEHLSNLHLHEPSLITMATPGLTGAEKEETAYVLPAELEELVIPCSLSEKPLLLLSLLSRHPSGRLLCFTNSRQATHRLYLLIKHFATVSVCELSSSLTGGQWKAILERFRQGKLQLLICSDAMSRGMDLVGVEAVVNYQLPSKFKTYLHRVGRTARAGERGTAYSLLDRAEVPAFTAMMRTAGRKKIRQLTVPRSEYEPFRDRYEHALKELRQDIVGAR